MDIIAYITLVVLVLFSLLVFVSTFSSIREISKFKKNFSQLIDNPVNANKEEPTILKGRLFASGEDVLRSPVSGDLCVAYKCYVSEHVRKNHFEKYLEETKSVPFKINTHLGDFYFENKVFDLNAKEGDYSVDYEFPSLDLYKQNLNDLPISIRENLGRLGVELSNRSNNLLDTAFQINQSIIPHDKDVYILGSFQKSENDRSWLVKPCSILNSIVISDTLDGIKTSMKKTMLFNLSACILSLTTPVALGYVILL